ncbi:MAG: hypothetical protein HC831_15200 [Chloroflexia bacterium]|nr:hypothetical protein [Chloroflexia bacterium]
MQFNIIKQYFPKNHIIDLTPFGNGHINDTYKVVIDGMPKDYILQKINTQVFLNPDGIIQNHLKLKRYSISIDMILKLLK